MHRHTESYYSESLEHSSNDDPPFPLDASAELRQTFMRENESLSNFLHQIEALAADAGYNNHDLITATLGRTTPHLKGAYEQLKALHKATPSLGDITYKVEVTALCGAYETFKEL